MTGTRSGEPSSSRAVLTGRRGRVWRGSGVSRPSPGPPSGDDGLGSASFSLRSPASTWHRVMCGGYGSDMANPNSKRILWLIFVVAGILLVLGAMFLVGALKGDHTDQIDPQNGQVITTFLR
ncbi:MAG: hypothetical protein JWP31_351 [Aeromicrobium sp.]|nr:hypothetical protein [Aeromicrobium sp.]